MDHGAYGGLFAAVGEDGILGMPRDRRAARPFDRHPDTGGIVAGRSLRGFDAMLDLGLRAHEAMDTPGIISWDIVFQATGPVIIEGNSTGVFYIVQAAHDETLGKPNTLISSSSPSMYPDLTSHAAFPTAGKSYRRELLACADAPDGAVAGV